MSGLSKEISQKFAQKLPQKSGQRFGQIFPRLFPEGTARRFRSNRRARFSLWAVSLCFGISLFADFIANERPLLAYDEGRLLFPVLQNLTEKDLGGELEVPVDWRAPYTKQELIQGWMLFPPIPFRYSTINYRLPSPAPSPPTKDNLLGTDDKGRDLLARILYGFRISVLFGLVLTICSLVIGVFVGALFGYYGGRIDLWGMRFLEVWSSMPQLFIIIIMSSVIVPNFWWLLGVLLLFSWISFVAVVRAEFLRARNFEFVAAAEAMGVHPLKIMFRHILPNAAVATITNAPFALVGGITALTSLDFLGFGLPPGSPSLGELVAQSKANLQAPWLGITSFVTIGGLLVFLLFIGEGVRDALDTRRKG